MHRIANSATLKVYKQTSKSWGSVGSEVNMDLAIASDAGVGGSAIPTNNFVLWSLLFPK